MYALYVLGSQLESFVGKVKFLIIYLFSALTGSLLSLISAILAGVQHTGRIFLGGILATSLSSLWGIASSILGIFTLLIFIRWIVLIINKGRTSYESGWNQIDMLLNKISYKVAGTFSRPSSIRYQRSLLISWISFLVILGAGHFLITILVNLCYRMPF
jgi:YggT family protein